MKKRDLSDVELREILSELLPLVRMDHVAPATSETLAQAIRRGLVSTPPSHMIGSDMRDSVRLNAWVRTSPNSNGLFVRPRLFMPYYEEIKVNCCKVCYIVCINHLWLLYFLLDYFSKVKFQCFNLCTG